MNQLHVPKKHQHVMARELTCITRARHALYRGVPDASPDATGLEQDFSTLLAQRYKGGREGRIVHWIVWNEADSSAWFDMSPQVDGAPCHTLCSCL